MTGAAAVRVQLRDGAGALVVYTLQGWRHGEPWVLLTAAGRALAAAGESGAAVNKSAFYASEEQLQLITHVAADAVSTVGDVRLGRYASLPTSLLAENEAPVSALQRGEALFGDPPIRPAAPPPTTAPAPPAQPLVNSDQVTTPRLPSVPPPPEPATVGDYLYSVDLRYDRVYTGRPAYGEPKRMGHSYGYRAKERPGTVTRLGTLLSDTLGANGIPGRRTNMKKASIQNVCDTLYKYAGFLHFVLGVADKHRTGLPSELCHPENLAAYFRYIATSVTLGGRGCSLATTRGACSDICNVLDAMRYLHSKGQLLQRELGLPYGLTIEKVRQWWHGVVTPLCAGVRPGKRTVRLPSAVDDYDNNINNNNNNNNNNNDNSYNSNDNNIASQILYSINDDNNMQCHCIIRV